MHTAKMSAATQPNLPGSGSHTYNTNAGATPNEMASERESSSAPIFEVASSRRAIRPSRLSSTAARPMAPIARPYWPLRANWTADKPAHSASTVIAFGRSRTPGVVRDMYQSFTTS